MTIYQWGKISPIIADKLQTQSEGLALARIIEEQRSQFKLITNEGVVVGQLAGKFLRSELDRLQRPTIGDWVWVRKLPNEAKAIIQEVADRTSLLHRKAAGDEPYAQPLAANVDLVFIVTSLNNDFNERRIERYLTIVFESKASPILVLSKSDLEPASENLANELSQKFKIPVVAISSQTGNGMPAFKDLLTPNTTSVFVGSSGVGKSTIVNALLGHNEQATAEVRASDQRGRHTTTSRKLIRLETGALVIDTPGMREVQLDSSHNQAISESFLAIEQFAVHCKFTNCMHESEPGCAVKAAIADGSLDPSVLASFQKLQKETRHQERKQNKEAASQDKKKWKSISKAHRKFKKDFE